MGIGMSTPEDIVRLANLVEERNTLRAELEKRETQLDDLRTEAYVAWNPANNTGPKDWEAFCQKVAEMDEGIPEAVERWFTERATLRAEVERLRALLGGADEAMQAAQSCWRDHTSESADKVRAWMTEVCAALAEGQEGGE